MILKQFNKTDRTILAVAIFLLLLSGYLLFDDSILNFSELGQSSDRIGSVSDSIRDVRKKLAGKLFWQAARNQENVHEGDSVFTGANSTVTVNLEDGTAITIEPNSLITFRKAGEQMELDLKQGRVRGDFSGEKKLKLRLPCTDQDSEGIELSGAGSSVRVGSDCKVQQVSGKSKVVGAKVAAVKDKGAKDAGVTLEEIQPSEKLEWTVPPPTQWAHFGFDRNLILQWNKVQRVGRFKVQYSLSKDFTEIIQEQVTTKYSISSKKYPADGPHFVRLILENSSRELIGQSEVRSIEFKNLPTPVLTEPLAESQIQLPLLPSGAPAHLAKIPVKWSFRLPSEFKVYLMDQKNKKVLKSHELRATEYIFENLTPGKYLVSVQELTYSNNSPMGRSKEHLVTVGTGEIPKLPPPQLVKNKIVHELPNEKSPELDWLPVEGADKYLVQWTEQKEFANPLEHRISRTRMELKNLKLDSYRFRVAAVTSSGAVGEFSEVGDLKMKLGTPEINPVEPVVIRGKTPDDPEPPAEVPVSWNSTPEVENFQVELSQNADFKNATRVTSRTPSSIITAPKAGDYFWRVRALDKTGKPLTPFSKKGAFNYTFKWPLGQPKLYEPISEITFFFQRHLNPYFWMEWSAVKQADFYIIEISKNTEFSEPIASIKSKSPRFLVTNKLPQGRLFWRVRAENNEGKNSDWSEIRSMNIFSGRSPAGGR